jgi:hypothetical protein
LLELMGEAAMLKGDQLPNQPVQAQDTSARSGMEIIECRDGIEIHDRFTD